jgi:non-specific serine/threonine protein kinase/serine/threonine-protein kinase
MSVNAPGTPARPAGIASTSRGRLAKFILPGAVSPCAARSGRLDDQTRSAGQDRTATDRAAPAPLPKAAAPAALPRALGPYELREVIGEGGMGQVWLADQTKPVRRSVAVKVIRAGMDSKQVVARFESERQALALMNHAAIAKVFDGGTTPEGQPFFVMEYVAGQSLTDHCDRERLSAAERIALLCEVCAGVQHAHQRRSSTAT